MAFEFSEEERAIFEYNDGTKPIKADPLEIRRRMLFTLPNVTQLMREHRIGEQMLAMKERQVYRVALQHIVYETLKENPATFEQIAAGMPNEPPKAVRALLNEMLNGGAIESLEPNYQSVKSDGAAAYFVTAEEKAKMTGEEASVIRFGKKAEETLCLGLRDVFGMAIGESGEGPTDAMVWKVFRFYQEWMEKKSGKAQAKPISSTNSAA